jgi:hypothetical protein
VPVKAVHHFGNQTDEENIQRGGYQEASFVQHDSDGASAMPHKLSGFGQSIGCI